MLLYKYSIFYVDLGAPHSPIRHRDKYVAQSSKRTLLRKESMAPAAFCGSSRYVSCTVTLQNVVLIDL